jgi:hypothetical protein
VCAVPATTERAGARRNVCEVEEYSSPHSSPHPEVGGHIALKTHVSSLKDEAYGQSDARRSHKGGDVGLVGFSR